MKHVIWFIAGLTVGCAALGLQPATTFEDKLAYAYGQVTAARKGALAIIQARCPNEASLATLPCQSAAKDGQHIQAMADQARTGLDQAKNYAALGNLTQANAQLQLESAALQALSTYLTSQGVK